MTSFSLAGAWTDDRRDRERARAHAANERMRSKAGQDARSMSGKMSKAKLSSEKRARPRGPKKKVLILDLDGSGLSLGFWPRRFEGGDEVEEADEESDTFPRRSNSTIKILSTYDLDKVWKEILNGEYHAIVVIDLPANETENDIPQPLRASFAYSSNLVALLPSVGRKEGITLNI